MVAEPEAETESRRARATGHGGEEGARSHGGAKGQRAEAESGPQSVEAMMLDDGSPAELAQRRWWAEGDSGGGGRSRWEVGGRVCICEPPGFQG